MSKLNFIFLNRKVSRYQIKVPFRGEKIEQHKYEEKNWVEENRGFRTYNSCKFIPGVWNATDLRGCI